MNEQRHIVWQMTTDGIVDLVSIFNHDEPDTALAATRDNYLRHLDPKCRLSMYACDCDNPNSHKQKVGHRGS
jgi:hypothetical protein